MLLAMHWEHKQKNVWNRFCSWKNAFSLRIQLFLRCLNHTEKRSNNELIFQKRIFLPSLCSLPKLLLQVKILPWGLSWKNNMGASQQPGMSHAWKMEVPFVFSPCSPPRSVFERGMWDFHMHSCIINDINKIKPWLVNKKKHFLRENNRISPSHLAQGLWAHEHTLSAHP